MFKKEYILHDPHPDVIIQRDFIGVSTTIIDQAIYL